MDFGQLQYFVTAAQTLNFTKAAELHFISQPAISRSINNLERELGVKLFYRSSHNVYLTQAGREFLEYANNVLSMTAKTRNRVSNIAAGRTGLLRISAVVDMHPMIHRVLHHFTRQHPNIQLVLKFASGEGQLAAINDGSVDVVFSRTALIESQPALSGIPIETDRMCIYVSNEQAALVNVNDFSGLQNLPLILERDSIAPFLYPQIIEICNNRGHRLTQDNIIQATSMEEIISLVNLGVGFTIAAHAMQRAMWVDYSVGFPIPGDDALVQNGVGWFSNHDNSAVDLFLGALKELYPDSGIEI